VPPTVSTPGKQHDDGSWIHSDGGHFYFTLPEGVELPPGTGSMTIGDTGIAVLWHNRYVLIPPSVRAEGMYLCRGRETELPTALGELITNRVTLRLERAAQRRAALSDDEFTTRVDAWAARESWADILGRHDWIPIAAAGSCGCPQFTAPGDHASPRSATAHDAGCATGMWTREDNAPLHIWTHHPGEPFESWIAAHEGSSTITKFQAVALLDYDGDERRAAKVLGLAKEATWVEGLDHHAIAQDQANMGNLSQDLPAPTPQQVGPDEWVGPLTVTGPPQIGDVTITGDGQSLTLRRQEDGSYAATVPPPADEVTTVDVSQMSLAALAGVEDDDLPVIGAVDPTTGLYIPTNPGVPQMAPFDHWSDTPPPEFIVEGLIEHRGLTCLIGSPNAGKSTVALDIAAHIALGMAWQGRTVLKTRVLYLPGEGLAGVVARLRAWCDAHSVLLGDDLMMGNGILQLGAPVESWVELRTYIAAQRIGLVIFDTLARMATNVDENSASDMGRVIKRFDDVRQETNAGVMVVHHTGKANNTVARGSSALNGAIDSELLVYTDGERVEIPHTNRTARPIHLMVTKQKNAEYTSEAIDLLMISHDTTPEDSAPIITGMGGDVDPMVGEPVLARPVPETLIETAIRVRLCVDRFTEQGISRTDIAADVRPDAYTAGLRNPAQRWRLKVAEAIDRGLRWGLLATAEHSQAKYVPGDVDIAAARTVAANELVGVPDAI
jgi:hypothetical protein